MLALTLALSLHLGAADLRPEAWVVVTRRSGVARPQALELARTLSTALKDRGVPNPTPADDAASCNAKVPCLVELAQKKGVSVIVTVEAGSALDDMVLHCEALSVEEFGKKLSTFDFTGPASGFAANLKDKVEEFFAPAVRGVLGVPTPGAPTAEKPEEKKPEPKPAVVAETPKPVEQPVTKPPEVAQAPASGGGMSTGRFVGIIAMGVGAVTLITSAVLGGLTLGTAGTYHSACPMNPCTNPAAYDAYKSAGTTQNAGVGLLITGALIAAAGAVLFVLDLGGSSPATVTPAASTDGMSLVLSGHF
jgi:hypothetical protein